MKNLILVLLALTIPMGAQAKYPSFFQVCYIDSNSVVGANYRIDGRPEETRIWGSSDGGIRKKILAAAEQAGVCPTNNRRPMLKAQYDLCLPSVTRDIPPFLVPSQVHWKVEGGKFTNLADRTVESETTTLFSPQYMSFSNRKAKKQYLDGLNRLVSAGVCPAVSLDIVD
ncbi:hypothetical protein ACLVWU_11680 [Bdellovibrio sp. HCB290]|uniref:hypothetical protein n=1 Tax=Bdellovibrio sp. HCB290 TaxID=3394356 RepID=UPI0039B4D6D5